MTIHTLLVLIICTCYLLSKASAVSKHDKQGVLATDLLLQPPDRFHISQKWPECVFGIRSQNACGTCWAFSLARVLSIKTCIESKGRARFWYSPEQLATCVTVSRNNVCDGSSGDYTDVQTTLENGIVPWAYWPYSIGLGIIASRTKPGSAKKCWSNVTDEVIPFPLTQFQDPKFSWLIHDTTVSSVNPSSLTTAATSAKIDVTLKYNRIKVVRPQYMDYLKYIKTADQEIREVNFDKAKQEIHIKNIIASNLFSSNSGINEVKIGDIVNVSLPFAFVDLRPVAQPPQSDISKYKNVVATVPSYTTRRISTITPELIQNQIMTHGPVMGALNWKKMKTMPDFLVGEGGDHMVTVEGWITKIDPKTQKPQLYFSVANSWSKLRGQDLLSVYENDDMDESKEQKSTEEKSVGSNDSIKMGDSGVEGEQKQQDQQPKKPPLQQQQLQQQQKELLVASKTKGYDLIPIEYFDNFYTDIQINMLNKYQITKIESRKLLKANSWEILVNTKVPQAYSNQDYVAVVPHISMSTVINSEQLIQYMKNNKRARLLSWRKIDPRSDLPTKLVFVAPKGDYEVRLYMHNSRDYIDRWFLRILDDKIEAKDVPWQPAVNKDIDIGLQSVTSLDVTPSPTTSVLVQPLQLCRDSESVAATIGECRAKDLCSTTVVTNVIKACPTDQVCCVP